jgi:hypothetical protein
MCFRYLILLSLLLISGCGVPHSKAYQAFYSHLELPLSKSERIDEGDFFLVILVDARHLNYSDSLSFLRSLAAEPTSRFGHAWIYLNGRKAGHRYVVEGGHSGELGAVQPTYFDGIMNYNDWGYANPTEAQKKTVRYEPDPIKYLWAVQQDGFFQKGAGGHTPTFAAKVNLTQEQFEAILEFIEREYPFEKYSLTGFQCASFVSQVAALADLRLDCSLSMSIQKQCFFGGRIVRFRQSPRYGNIHFCTPDLVEKRLISAVKEGRAEYALEWYKEAAFSSNKSI